MSEWLQGRRRTAAATENVACRLREVEEAVGNSAKQLPTSKKKLLTALGAEINSNSLPWECAGSKVHGKAVRACLLVMARENISAGGSVECW